MSRSFTKNYYFEVAKGDVTGDTSWHKFGYNLDVDTGSEEIIAAFGGTFAIMTSADTLDVVSSDATDDDGNTGANTILIVGIDENNAPQTETVTMNGTTTVTTTNQWLGVNRVYVLSSGSNGANAGNITIDDTSGTVGTQAYLPAGESVTQQLIFHTSQGYSFLMTRIILNALKLSGGGGSPRITFKAYSYSRVTATTYEVFRKNIDTGISNLITLDFDIPLVFTGREVIYFTAETDISNTAVSGRFTGIQTLL